MLMSEKKDEVKKGQNETIPNDDPTDVSAEELEDFAKEAIKKFKSLQ